MIFLEFGIKLQIYIFTPLNYSGLEDIAFRLLSYRIGMNIVVHINTIFIY